MRPYKLGFIVLNVIIVFAIALFIAYMFNGNNLFSSARVFWGSVGYGTILGLSFWIANGTLGFFISKHRLWHRKPQQATVLSLLSYFLVGVIISLGVPYFWAKNVFHVPENYFWNHVLINGFICLTIDLVLVSFFFSKYLVKYWMESMQNEEKLKQEKLIAQYETLKNQVNPHFLFNSLNTLTGVVEQNPKEAVHFIKKLSDIYRYVLEQKDKAVVMLSEELIFVKDYIYLMKIRHGEGLDSSVLFDDERAYVAPLAIQMLVENALKHNIVSDDQPLLISLFKEGDYLVVKNNYQKKKVISAKDPVGLENLVSRYSYLSDKKVIIETSSTEFVVKLPILEEPAE